MSTKYIDWSIARLKEELRKRGAKLSGRKPELVDRLESYDRNDNFGYTEPKEILKMKLPPMESYKDINSKSNVPRMNLEDVKLYLITKDKTLIEESAVQMYNESFIRYIRSSRIPQDGLCYLHASVWAEMSKNVNYNVHMCLDSDGIVKEAQCECPVGSWPSAHCKHVVTIMLGIVDFSEKGAVKTEATCTEKLQTFHCPKQKYKGSPIKSNMLPMKKHKLNPKPTINKTESEEATVQTDMRPAKFVNNTGYQSYFNNTILNYECSSSLQASQPHRSMPFLQLIQPANPYAIEQDHQYLQLSTSDTILNDLNVSRIDEATINMINSATQSQSNSNEWHDQRSHRITASRMGSICKSTERRDMKKLALSIVDPKSFHSRATTHGIKYESHALSLYETITGRKVTKSGLVIHPGKPHLAASPDGICDDRVIEVKCPFSAKNKSITALNVPYLFNTENGRLSLKKNHDYYYQVMGQLYVTGKEVCDFVVFTLIDLEIISIKADHEFIDNMVNKLDSFYHNHLKQEILNKCLYKDFNKYKSFSTDESRPTSSAV